MKNGNYSKAKVMTLIPVIVFLVTVICFVIASILEVPTSRGAVYSVLILISIISIFLAPLLCLVISIIGTVFASKAKKEGRSEAKKFFILGLIEILFSILGALLAVLMFIGGQSV